jgi:hypothetical protein
MSTQKVKDLVSLIQSMSKGEKRRFITFAGGIERAESTYYLHLFRIYAAHGLLSDEEIPARIPGVKPSQLSNLRAHLWRQLLECLRAVHASRWPAMEVRASLDFALLLQHRGLQGAAAAYAEQALAVAEASGASSLTYHALDVQRSLHTEFFEGNDALHSPLMDEKSSIVIDTVSLQDKLLNTMYRLQQWYHRQGYVKNDAEYEAVCHMFDQAMPRYQPLKGSHHDNILYYQTQVWYRYITQDFVSCYRYAAKWVRLFESRPATKSSDPVLYLKALHHALNALFMGGKLPSFLLYFEQLTLAESHWNEQLRHEMLSLYSEYHATHLCNRIFLTGQYTDGINEIQSVELLLAQNPLHWHSRKRLTLSYKVACVYFGADRHAECLDYLNAIINSPDDGSLQDIRSFARMLALICHYELGNEVFVAHQIRSVYRYLHKMKDLQAVQRAVLSFLKQSAHWKPSEMPHHFQSLRLTLMDYRNHPYEKRPFLYLDIIAWLDSKLLGMSIQEIIRLRVSGRKE